VCGFGAGRGVWDRRHLQVNTRSTSFHSERSLKRVGWTRQRGG
jgi:hypothetical protein